MNERIKALLLQNRTSFTNGVTDTNDGVYIHGSEENLEKFAELIVSDVLSEVGKFIRRNPGYWDEYGLVTDITPIYAGVKE